MLIKAILASAFAALLRLQGDQLSLEKPLVMGTVVGLVYGNLPLGLAIGATLDLMWMGIHAVGGAVSSDVTTSTVIATALACSLGLSVSEAIALAVPISLLARLVGTLKKTFNTLMGQKLDVLADQGKIDTLLRWAVWFYAYAFATEFLVNFIGIYFGSGPVSAFLATVPPWVMSGLKSTGGIMPAIGFAMTLRVMFKMELLPYLILGFVLGAYLQVPVLGVAAIGAAIAIIKFQIDTKMNARGVSSNG